MTMVPSSAVLACLESVSSSGFGRNGTLSNTRNPRYRQSMVDGLTKCSYSPVFRAGIELLDPMPVHASSISLQAIGDVDLKDISPICCKNWAGKLTVDDHHFSRSAIRRQDHTRDVEAVLDNLPSVRPFLFAVSVDREASGPAISRCWAVSARCRACWVRWSMLFSRCVPAAEFWDVDWYDTRRCEPNPPATQKRVN